MAGGAEQQVPDLVRDRAAEQRLRVEAGTARDPLHGVEVDRATEAGGDAPGCIHLAVVGAHLTGEPLNTQLTGRGARLVESRRTSPEYRFYALANTTPPKPGLVREPGFEGPGIALEIWAVPSQHFGSFVAGVPPPLGIGSVQLDTGEWVKGFICEPAAIAGATEITGYRGWRNYLASRTNRGSPAVARSDHEVEPDQTIGSNSGGR